MEGATGTAGSQGLTGSSPQGATGATGGVGPQGFQGPQGEFWVISSVSVIFFFVGPHVVTFHSVEDVVTFY